MDENNSDDTQLLNKQSNHRTMFSIAGKLPHEIRNECRSAIQRFTSSVTQSSSVTTTTVTFTSANNSTIYTMANAAISSPCLGTRSTHQESSTLINSGIVEDNLSDAARRLLNDQNQRAGKRKNGKPLSPISNPKRGSSSQVLHSPPTTSLKISSNNRFAILDTDISTNEESVEGMMIEGADIDSAHMDDSQLDGSNTGRNLQETHNTANQLNDHKKPPQIVVNIRNLNDLFELIKEKTSLDNVVVKANQGETVRIFPKDSDTYRKIVSHMDDIGIQFHTYQMLTDKPHRIVVRDLHHSTSNKDITADLKCLGYEVLHIHNPSSRTNKDEKLNIFFINIKPCAKINEIYHVKTLCRQKIRIERMRKSSEIAQCRRCQEYGHTAKYCRRHPNCARCGENHQTMQCTRPIDALPTCYHCSENHTASFKGCLKYQELLRRSMGPARNGNRLNKNIHNHSPRDRQELPALQPNYRKNNTQSTVQQLSTQPQLNFAQSQPSIGTGGNRAVSYATVVKGYPKIAPSKDGPAQRQRLNNPQTKQILQQHRSNTQQNNSSDVQVFLQQQQQQFLEWQQQIQQQQHQQFLMWLQQQQQEQLQYKSQTNQRLEKLEKMVLELANMLKEWAGSELNPQLFNNVSASL